MTTIVAAYSRSTLAVWANGRRLPLLWAAVVAAWAMVAASVVRRKRVGWG